MNGLKMLADDSNASKLLPEPVLLVDLGTSIEGNSARDDETNQRQQEAHQRRAQILTKQLLQNQLTSLRLEKYSVNSIRFLILIIVIINCACIALGTMISSLALVTSSNRVDGIYVEGIDKTGRTFVLFAEASSRLLACVIIFCTLILFGIRITAFYWNRSKSEAQSVMDKLNNEEKKNEMIVLAEIAGGVINSALVAESALERAAIRLVHRVGGFSDADDGQETSIFLDNRWLHFKEQFLLLSLLLVIMVNPTCSIWGIVYYLADVIDGTGRYLGLFQVVFIGRTGITDSTRQASIALNSLFISFFHFFLYAFFHFQDRLQQLDLSRKQAARRATKENADTIWNALNKKPSNDKVSGPILHGHAFNSWNRDQSDLHALQEINMAYDSHRIRAILDQWERKRQKVFRICSRRIRENLFFNIELKFILPLITYFGLNVGFGLAYIFQPSFVPLVSFVTLIRVCSLNSSILTFRVNDTIFRSDRFIYEVTYESNIQPDMSLCSPYQPLDTRPFKICVIVAVLCVFDLYFIYLIWMKSKRTRSHLSVLTYESTRSDQLGFSYFRVITLFSVTAFFILSFIIVSVEPLSSFLLTSMTIDGSNLTREAFLEVISITFKIQPLAQVGIGPLVYGFGSIYLILSIQVTSLAFGFSPYETLRNEKAMYLSYESDVHILAQMTEQGDHESHGKTNGNSFERGGGDGERDKEMENPPPMRKLHAAEEIKPYLKALQKQQTLRRFHSHPDLKGSFTNLLGLPSPPLSSQIESGVLVLETAVLMYHFMSISYNLTDMKIDETKNELTEMQSAIEDKRFQICIYAKDTDSDTHAFVFASDDRIIISFRGSVSFKNYKTDWDSTEVVAENALNVVPLITDEVNLRYARKIAERTPYVHGGFVKAYATVREQIRETVFELLQERTKMARCVYVTGHSLGGVSLL